MHRLFEQLGEDHQHFQRLLSVLSHEMNQFKETGHLQESIPMILDAIKYIEVYPESWHHPVEDLVFDFVKSTYPMSIMERAAIEHVEQEHEVIDQQKRKFLHVIHLIMQDKVVPIEKVLSIFNDFSAQQALHIETENKIVYPILERYMTEDDWQCLALQVENIKDPLFSEQKRAGYERLYQHIMATETVNMLKPVEA